MVSCARSLHFVVEIKGGFRLAFAGSLRFWLGLTLLAAAVARLPAFPPAPHYTIYGVVRDQAGATLSVEGADLVLLRDNLEIGRAVISKTLIGDRNYELHIRIDQNRPALRIYSHDAVPAQGLFSLVVEMNGQRFYPIEVSGTLRAGNGGERVRIDLNLGADTDNDGLPDAWEQWQLFQAGRVAGPNGWDLSLLDRDGDFDHDGISNYREYLAGTFAGDATQRFQLTIKGKTASAVQFEFFGITGKIYSIEESIDLRTWAVIPFSITPAGAAAGTYQATAVATLQAYVTAPSGAARFYRLSVR